MSGRDDWEAPRDANLAHWDEVVPIHMAADSYDLTPLREGRGQLHPIEQAELGSVEGLRVLHLQCHFGRDSLILAQQGAAEVVGLDFSPEAVQAATQLAAELNLPARFVQADLFDARTAIPEPASFDRVFVTWGAIYWLNDIREWARIVAHFLKPGGALYLAEGHPSAFVFDSSVPGTEAFPAGPAFPYFLRGPQRNQGEEDYADPNAEIKNDTTYFWAHQLGEIVTALIDAGLNLRFLHEHTSVPWAMYKHLVKDENGMYHWPDKEWLPLAFSLMAEKR